MTRPSKAKSAISNGTRLLADVDGRSVWARRFRDLFAEHLSDLGGAGATSEAERSVIRRAATIIVELERLETQFAQDGGARAVDLDLYLRAAGTLKRLYEATGLQKRVQDVAPDLQAYVRGKAGGHS